MEKKKETLAERIKVLRKEKKMTQLELAELLNVTDKAVSKWETDEGNPDISLLSKLSEIFNVTIDYLLTGKKPEEKVVLISKAEYCAKNDDTTLLEELINNPPKPDEKGYTLFDYIMKYDSVKVFKKLIIDKKISLFLHEDILQSLNRVNYNTKHIKQLVINKVVTDEYDSFDILIMLLKTGLTNALPTLGLGSIGDANYFEWDIKLYDYVLSANLSDEDLDVIFKNSTEGTGLWLPIYSKYIEKAVEQNNEKLLKYLLDKVDLINDSSFEMAQKKAKENKKVRGYKNRDVGYIDNETKKQRNISYQHIQSVSLESVPLSINNNRNNSSYDEEQVLFFVALSTKTLEFVKIKNFAMLTRLNEINRKVGSYTYSKKEMELIEMKARKTHSDDEIFIHSCMEGGLLNIEKVIDSPNLVLIKKAMNNYPIHFYEVLKKMVKNKEYKKLFELAVDLNSTDLRMILLTDQYEHFEKVIYDIATNNIGYFAETNKVQLQNMQFAKKILEKNNRQKEGYINANTLMEYLNLVRELCLTEVSWKVDTENLVEELTEQYFLDKLDNNQDLLIIKLCLLLEAKLKVNYSLNGDLSEMLDKYARLRFYGDDGWGYIVELDKYTPDILYRLRVMRNNLVHSQKNPVKGLEKQELLDAIKHIIEM